jgi:hypothetical protein
MARLGLMRHRKFRAAARAINNTPLLRGCLEMIWDAANDTLDDVIGSAEDVEEVAGWKGKRGALVAVLTAHESNFLDQRADGQYVIHDYWEHAPDYVRKRAQRAEVGPYGRTPNGGQTADKRRTNGGHHPTTVPPNGASRAPGPCRAVPSGGVMVGGGTPIVRPRDPSAAFDWLISVPGKLHTELVGREAVRHKGDTATAEQGLLEWYSTTALAWNDRELPGDDGWGFWRKRYAEWRGTSSTSAPVQHDLAAARAAFVGRPA